MNLGFLVKLRSFLSGGSLRIGKEPNMRYWPRFRYRRGKIEIGDRLFTRCGVIIDAQSGVITIGNDVSINDYSILLGHGGIQIGDNVRIAAHVVVVAFEHRYNDPAVPIRLQPVKKDGIVIGDDVWIGAGAKVLAGCHIAQGCVIGANSVVKGATVPFGVYVGAPARLVKTRTAKAVENGEQ
ncbi:MULTISPECIES: acyltransferase [Rhizobium]|nr:MULTISPECIES: acyltransferase [Rhizobium]MCA0802282.1 acyltransferase [Rhizobium sp. T1473]MCS0462163.1 acyltransferase [Rhizobium favelukesii]UFS80872.1 acyltransferase [Rhizobium sp. T136]